MNRKEREITMSRVTDCILTFPLTGMENEEEIIDQINQSGYKFVWIEDKKFPRNSFVTGGKVLQINTLIGAFNHLNLNKLIKHLTEEVDWEEPDRVQLFINEEESEGFKELRIGKEKPGILNYLERIKAELNYWILNNELGIKSILLQTISDYLHSMGVEQRMEIERIYTKLSDWSTKVISDLNDFKILDKKIPNELVDLFHRLRRYTLDSQH